MMTEAKFTPGPWHYRRSSFGAAPANGFGIYTKDRKRQICGNNQCDPGDGIEPFMHWDELGANARLIAAAPDMLAALQEIEEFLVNQADVDDGRPNDAMRLLVELRSALAKATGAA